MPQVRLTGAGDARIIQLRHGILRNMRIRYELLAILALACLMSCGGESEALVRRKLEVILNDDLQSVITELPPASVADSTWYVIREYQHFSKGGFSALAVVDFHFIKGDIARMVRKYRYHRRFGQWERYHNVYEVTSADEPATLPHAAP